MNNMSEWSGEVNYSEVPKDAFQPHDTWIITFCPDTASFFTTDQRAFFWETGEEFPSEADAIAYFEHHIPEFVEVENNIMKHIRCFGKTTDEIFLENTKMWYGKNGIKWRKIKSMAGEKYLAKAEEMNKFIDYMKRLNRG